MDTAAAFPQRLRLLIADGDAAALDETSAGFHGEGFAVTQAADLDTAWRCLHETAPDVLLLDAGLAEGAILATIRTLRGRLPGLLLGVQTSAPRVEEEIILTELGADLYWGKPLSPRLAGARLRAALRRAGREPALLGGTALSLGEGMLLEPESRAVCRADGTRIRLARSELALLRCLAKAGRGFAQREDIAAEVLGRIIRYGDRSVDNLVLGLRRKLGMDAEYGAIRSVRGIGYRLVRPDPAGRPEANPG